MSRKNHNPIDVYKRQGEYTMKSDGKPFFDVVSIFAANINVDSKTGRVHVFCNEMCIRDSHYGNESGDCILLYRLYYAGNPRER